MRTLLNRTILCYMVLLGCATTKIPGEHTTEPDVGLTAEQYRSRQHTAGSMAMDLDSQQDLLSMSTRPEAMVSPENLGDTMALSQDIYGKINSASNTMTSKATEIPDTAESLSAVAKKIVENYQNSKNKEPGGHCLMVSKRRFEKAYRDVYGHSVYEDLPDRMATPYYTSKEVFDYLYVSASGTHQGWRSLPMAYRGKGNAGAIAYAGMGELVDGTEIWTGMLRPGALMQVWKRRTDYNKVVYGVDQKDFDPFGHSFIFLDYVRDENHDIIGITIADQGYQSYRTLLPQDYEVWWAVNLTI